MTRNQLHGKQFEDLIKGSSMFRGASDHGRSGDARFDVEGKFDRILAIPTSIKTTGSGVVAMADARRFWEIEEPFRMLVGRYKQEGRRKIFHEVDEFIIHGDMLLALRGATTLQDVAMLHDGIGLGVYPPGSHVAARDWVWKKLESLEAHRGLIRLNPKIDSKRQRRLQCSVTLSGLISLAKDCPDFISPRTGSGQISYRVHDEDIGGIGLPMSVVSTAREFSD